MYIISLIFFMDKRIITVKIPEEIYFKMKEDIIKAEKKYKGYISAGEFIATLILEHKGDDEVKG